MEMIFEILYHTDVVKKDIPQLGATWKRKIQLAIEKKLATAPETFGKPLRRSLKGYRQLRVGDYRVIFRIEENKVKILAILHRSIVYELIDKRL